YGVSMQIISKCSAPSHFILAMITVIVGIMTQDAHAQYDPESLRTVAVHVLQDPPQSWTGYGIYLRDGLVITAAQVVGAATHAKPSIRIGGEVLPAKVLKESPFEKDDLTLLSFGSQSLPTSLRMRRTSLCEAPPIAGEPVLVAIPEGT